MDMPPIDTTPPYRNARLWRRETWSDMSVGGWVGLFGAARRASGLTVERAAASCGITRPTYNARERDPVEFRLSELSALYADLDAEGRSMLERGVMGALRSGAGA